MIFDRNNKKQVVASVRASISWDKPFVADCRRIEDYKRSILEFMDDQSVVS